MPEEAVIGELDPWRRDVALLESALGTSYNFVSASPHSTRHGLEGYDLYFSSKYLFERAVDELRSYGFQVHSMSTDTYKDDADFKVRVERFREPNPNEFGIIEDDHYLLPEDYSA